MSLKEHEIMALRFLAGGPDQVGVITTEEQMAAALVYIDLEKRGYIIGDQQPTGGPLYTIAPNGLRALAHED